MKFIDYLKSNKGKNEQSKLALGFIEAIVFTVVAILIITAIVLIGTTINYQLLKWAVPLFYLLLLLWLPFVP